MNSESRTARGSSTVIFDPGGKWNSVGRFVWCGSTIFTPNATSTRAAILAFIHDTIASTLLGYLTGAMAFHHLASFLVTFSVFYLQSCGSEVATGIFLAELSNPCNLTREILKHFKLDKTKLYMFLSFGFAGIFAIARFVILPFFLAALYPAPTHLAVKIMAGLIWFVSWHWLFIIFGFALKAIKEATANGKPNGWTTAYAAFSKARKNKVFLASYYLGAAWLSFGTIYLAHGKA